jgi:hypothetical protein
MSGRVKSYPQGVVKSQGKPSGNSETRAANTRSFGVGGGNVMADLIEKKYGVPGDEVPYWDPYGHLTGQPIDLREDLMKHWRPTFEAMNESFRQDRNASLDYVTKQAIEKNMERANFSIPIYFTPEVYITDDEATPFADMVPRVAVQQDTIEVDEEIDIGDTSSFQGGESANPAWPENDDSYLNHSYDVYAYGRQNTVSDFVQLAAQTLRSTRALTEEAQVRSIRQYEERQMLLGRGTNLTAAGNANDANGFLGILDFVNDPAAQIADEAGAQVTLNKVREQIKKLRREGKSSRDNIAHLTDHTTFEDLKSDLTEFSRYDSPGDTFDFGFNAIIVDNTPIFETHGLRDVNGERVFISHDMSAGYAGMLQDVTMHPLARTSPVEDFAVDAYGSMVGESTRRTYALENLA